MDAIFIFILGFAFGTLILLMIINREDNIKQNFFFEKSQEYLTELSKIRTWIQVVAANNVTLGLDENGKIFAHIMGWDRKWDDEYDDPGSESFKAKFPDLF